MTPVHQAADLLAQCGVSTVPILPTGQKRPSVRWEPYQSRIARAGERALFYQQPRGLAVIGGPVSGNLEILDFDDVSAVAPWYAVVDAQAPGLVHRLVAVKTPSGGAHYYYRHEDAPARNQKLAMTLHTDSEGIVSPMARVETRGDGGYAIVPPSPGACHPSGLPYQRVRGSLTALPLISAAERGVILAAARAQATWTPPPIVEATAAARGATDGERPGDDFNARASWADILEPHGWRALRVHGTETIWRRPGKSDGQSATTGHGGHNALYVFTSNAYPFEPNRGYTPFTAYALLSHRGDFADAARALAERGFGQDAPRERRPLEWYQAAAAGFVPRAQLEDIIHGAGVRLTFDNDHSFLRGACPLCREGRLWIAVRAQRWGCPSCGLKSDATGFIDLMHGRTSAARRAS